MVATGKTGADATFKAVHHVCRVMNRYQTKFLAVSDAALSAAVITADQHTAITVFIAGLSFLCDALEALASYSGF